MAFENRIVEIKVMRSRELQDHAGNWRTHPVMQREGLTGILEQVGIVDVLLAYRSERQGGSLTVIDGHLRKDLDPEQEWPVALLDLNDEEADLILATHDPLAAMAGTDPEKLKELLERTVIATDELAVQEIFRTLKATADELLEEQEQKQQKEEAGPEAAVPEMDLLPFEHYDYLVFFFKNSLDFEQAIEFFGIGKARYTATSLKGKTAAKVGAARVLDGGEALARIWQHQAELQEQATDER